MASDPTVSGRDALKALQKLGFRLDRVEGSHHMLVKDGHPYTIVVPVHGSQPLPNGTLRSIIRISGAGKKRFFEAMR